MTTNEKPLVSSWATLGALAIAAIGVEIGCGAERSTTDDDSYVDGLDDEARSAFLGTLEDVWPEVVQGQLAETITSTIGLLDAVTTLATDSTSEDARATAQEAWIDAMTSWQRMEVMQMGAAGSGLTVNGGQDIRDEIYSWPVTNRCLVDQRTARQEYTSSTFFEDTLVNSYGFDALETLLFSTPNEHDCASVLTDHTALWNTLGEDGVAQARADYATAITQKILVDIERIQADWEDGYATNIATAGQDESTFETDLDGMNAIFDALFYMETQVKDKKFGWPLGLTSCGTDDCSGKVESTIAGTSHLWIASNLEGFRSLFTGNDGLGMYDLLVSIDEEALANDVVTKLDQADAALIALQYPLDESVESDIDGLTAAHEAVKAVTDLLKSDIPTVLTLKVPQEAAGDND